MSFTDYLKKSQYSIRNKSNTANDKNKDKESFEDTSLLCVDKAELFN